jgi:hypothetical protein
MTNLSKRVFIALSPKMLKTPPQGFAHLGVVGATQFYWGLGRHGDLDPATRRSSSWFGS